MTLQADIKTALTGVASNQVYPQFVEEGVDLPFVVYRIASKDATGTMAGEICARNSIAVFECYAATYTAALALADDVRTAITGSSLTYYEESAPGEEYAYDADVFMEPVYYGFWH